MANSGIMKSEDGWRTPALQRLASSTAAWPARHHAGARSCSNQLGVGDACSIGSPTESVQQWCMLKSGTGRAASRPVGRSRFSAAHKPCIHREQVEAAFEPGSFDCC